MPMHDWTKVDAGIFHAFHLHWISALSDILNTGLLPGEYYALPEQMAVGYGPDVLTLQGRRPDSTNGSNGSTVAVASPLKSRPTTRFSAESDAEFYRRKKKAIVIRHVSGDDVVAVMEIVSPGNKAGQKPFRAFVDKVYDLLEQRIHLLIIDPFPPGPRDPDGVHAAIWQEVVGDDDPFHLPKDKPLTTVAYECDVVTRAYIEPLAVGDPLPEMPLFVEPNGCVTVPLESTYETAFAKMPRRWRDELR